MELVLIFAETDTHAFKNNILPNKPVMPLIIKQNKLKTKNYLVPIVEMVDVNTIILGMGMTQFKKKLKTSQNNVNKVNGNAIHNLLLLIYATLPTSE